MTGKIVGFYNVGHLKTKYKRFKSVNANLIQDAKLNKDENKLA